MANNYIPDLSQLAPGDLARSADINERYENTVSAFDVLPAPAVGKKGFNEPIAVGEPLDADHAVSKNYLEVEWLSQANKDQLMALNLTNLNTVAGSVASVNTVATDIFNVNQLAAAITAVNNVNAISADVQTVSSINAAVSTAAANNANITTVATNDANITTVAGSIANVNTVSASIANVDVVAADLLEPVSEIETVAGSIANVDLVGGSIANVNAVGPNIADVAVVSTDLQLAQSNIVKVSTDIANVNAVGTNINSVNTVATNDANVTTVATNIANVNTVAGISTNVTTVATDQANVNTVAGSIGNVNTVSSNITNVNNVGGSISNVNSVAADLALGASSTIGIVAADGADIGTVASNIGNVNTVAGISSDVTTVASNTANIASVVANLTDIQNADTYAAQALQAKNDAEAIYDQFDDRFLGAKTANPALDNDGNPLLAGAMYYNTSIGRMRVYSGSAWEEVALEQNLLLVKANNLSDLDNVTTAKANLAITAPEVSYDNTVSGIAANDVKEALDYLALQTVGLAGAVASYKREEFNATAGQTVFTTTGYTVGYVEVYQNGILLDNSDFNASNGTDVVLITGASLNDEINIIMHDSFDIAKLLDVTNISASAAANSITLDASNNLSIAGNISAGAAGSITAGTGGFSGSGANITGVLKTGNNLSDLTNTTTARSNLGLGGLATKSSVSDAEIDANSVGASELKVTGNGTAGQALTSNGLGSMSWTTLANVATSGSYGDLSGTPTLATVAGTGSYSDLSNLPTLGSLAAKNSVTDAEIDADSVGASELKVTGNGTTGQFLRTNTTGGFEWAIPTDTNTTYSAGNGIGLTGTTFSVAAGTGLTQQTSGLALSHLGIQSLTDPNADRVMFWDDSANAMQWLTMGSNLAISGTTLNATDTNTTYSAGQGIRFDGTEINWDFSNSSAVTGDEHYGSATDGYPKITMGKSGGTDAARTQTGDNQVLGEIAADGYTGTAWTGGAKILFQSSEAITSTNRGTEIILRAIAAGGSATTDVVWAGGNDFTVNGNRVLTTADEGAGKGIDADTLDGSHASAFATSGHTHSTITWGTGLSGTNYNGSAATTVALDFSELTDMTADIAGTTEFILQNGAVESRKAASEIKLSAFNNDLGLGSLATLNSVTSAYIDANAVGSSEIAANAVGASELNVTGNGTAGQLLSSDADGSFSWVNQPESFASGTLMLFQQTAAPTGWTKQTTHNDKALRVVSGTASSGGTSAFTTALGTPSVSGTVSINGAPAVGNLAVSVSGNIAATTLSVNTIPSHSHNVSHQNGVGGANTNYEISQRNSGGNFNNFPSGNYGNSGSHGHNHNMSGTLNGAPSVGTLGATLSGSTAAINVQYVDLIIASKD